MLIDMGWSLKDIVKITGLKYSSVRSKVTSNDFSRWLKVAVVVYETMKKDMESKKE